MPSGGLVRPKGDHYALTSPHPSHGLAQPQGRAPIATLNPNGILTPAGAPITDASLPILLLRGPGPWGVPVVSLRCEEGGCEGRRHSFQGKIDVSQGSSKFGYSFRVSPPSSQILANNIINFPQFCFPVCHCLKFTCLSEFFPLSRGKIFYILFSFVASPRSQLISEPKFQL